ncbi:DUF1738 domain-containing protein [Ruegeria litorea]|uniref:DUF1738 domain-containing protein n=1 Tax=Falsiruegeria litorea TaxID=1280831 RepID=A0ABS5WV46_9RHOB|nr:zincin-like metallopeptidase domain-containing protein [Falsiruegeria litorea]MBT3142928.1 DUF1738 domain-containing protein [Falsiruegeria litorea]
MKRDIHAEITNTIIEAIENGTAPWCKEWDGAMGFPFPRRVTGENYQGINVLLLWIAAEAKGYTAPTWMTFNQAKKMGGQVRKGEKGTGIVFFSTFEKESEENDNVTRIPFLKRYTVFNVQQIDGLPAEFQPSQPASVAGGEQAIEDLEAFFAYTGAKIENGPEIAPHWNPMNDTIGMPPVEQFSSAHAYYGTLAHELIHWTGHTPRLDRDMKYNTKEGRAFEELIAEIGSCFLCGHIGAQPNIDNSAAYVESWLKALRNDKRFIFRAATQAQRASDYALQKGRPLLTVIAAE